jgi:hypothetical protein
VVVNKQKHTRILTVVRVEITTLMMKASNRTLNPCSHHTMIMLVINPCAHELTSPRRLIHVSAIKNTRKNREEAIKILGG